MTTPRLEAQRARQVGDAGRRQRAGQQHVDAGRGEARLERRLDHVAGDARVLADQHRRARARPALQHAADGMAQAQHEVGRDRRLPTVPRMPSVPKYVLLMVSSAAVWSVGRSAAPARLPDRQRIDRRGDIVHAHDARAALHRQQRRRDAGRQRARSTGAGRSSCAAASTCATSRPAAAGRARAARAGARSSSRLCSGVLPKPMPGSRTMRSRAMPAPSHRVDRARAGTRAPRHDVVVDAARACIVAASPCMCIRHTPQRRVRGHDLERAGRAQRARCR